MIRVDDQNILRVEKIVLSYRTIGGDDLFAMQHGFKKTKAQTAVPGPDNIHQDV
jgi:hypothetical protein